MDRAAGARLAWRTAWVAFLASLPLAIAGWAISANTVTALFGDSFAGVSDMLWNPVAGHRALLLRSSPIPIPGRDQQGGLERRIERDHPCSCGFLAFVLIPEYGGSVRRGRRPISYGLHTILVAIAFLRVTRTSKSAPIIGPRLIDEVGLPRPETLACRRSVIALVHEELGGGPKVVVPTWKLVEGIRFASFQPRTFASTHAVNFRWRSWGLAPTRSSSLA